MAIASELRHAFRALLRAPGFTAAALLSLAFSLGANGRLRPGVTVAHAEASLDGVMAGLRREHPDLHGSSGIDVRRAAHVDPIRALRVE